MPTGLTLRVARPTDHLTAITAMYTQGLDFSVLAQFVDHGGFDGTVLGTREDPYHIEFTSRPGQHAGRAPTEEHLLVFYVPDRVEWEARCARMLAAGFCGVSSANPYWDLHGRTFEDLDGYHVVLQNSAWEG